ncbi:low molecular weight protein arginine phosphatase [Anaerotignum faecicola]|nr:low molecular weight protein arginine phosphatase [Anaerotignum faecicola]
MNILFVCTGNTCRSPMAEAVAKSIFPKEGIEIRSAGINTGGEHGASENAVLAAAELGLDLKKHKPTQITLDLIKWADIILTMTNGQKQAIAGACAELNVPVFTIAEYSGHGGEEVPDPYGCGLDIYEDCIITLKKYIAEIADILMK